MSQSRQMRRRSVLVALSGAGLSVGAAGCVRREGSTKGASRSEKQEPVEVASQSDDAVSKAVDDPVTDAFALGFRWKTFDPFLFCVHHLDRYPEANAELGPSAALDGRQLGSDFEGKDGWRMYHGRVVPGFPRHPHRGFETVTITRRGFVDHSDSLGATARYGEGDVQWMTAGSGIMHAEMFPLLNREAPNPAELFQIWLNLPRRDKFVAPHFSMFWNEKIPEHEVTDGDGRKAWVRIIAGSFSGKPAPAPPPSSWASRSEADVAIWSVRMQEGASLTLPAAGASTERTLYFFAGTTLRLQRRELATKQGARLARGRTIRVTAVGGDAEWLLLQGRPIGEPVVQRGPFVMNTSEEIRQAYQDYRQTQFGGWPWQNDAPVHQASEGRFAIHADGRKERAS